MEQALKNKWDHALFAQLQTLPIFSFHRLIRPDLTDLDRQKKAFLCDGTPPVFTYSKALAYPIETYINSLDRARCNIEEIPAPAWLQQLYTQKIDELHIRAQWIKAMQHKDDHTVVACAQHLFETSKEIPLEELAGELTAMCESSNTFHIHRKTIDAPRMHLFLQDILNAYGLTQWRIVPSKRSSLFISRKRDYTGGTVHLPRNFQASRSRARRIAIHEIEVHALRTHNGQQSPLHLLAQGLDRYTQTEEGLALYYQKEQGGKQKQFDPGFWEAYAYALCKNMDFNGVFNALMDARVRVNDALGKNEPYEELQERMWRVCVRAYRGVHSPSEPGLATGKDRIYRQGLRDIEPLDLIAHPARERILFLGNLGLHHEDMLKDMDTEYVQTPHLLAKTSRFRKSH